MLTKINSCQLNSISIDWAMAHIENLPVKLDPMGFKTGSQAGYWVWDEKIYGTMLLIGDNYSPSKIWSQGGAILEKAGISLVKKERWIATTTDGFSCEGETPLIAAMRAYITSKMGENIEIPDILINTVN